MRLSTDQLERFEDEGFLVLPRLFGEAELAPLRAELPALFAEETPANVIEKDSGEVRTAMGLHRRSPRFDRLTRHPRLVEPALQILGEAAYIQQTKVNVKAAFSGEIWQWHYDFATHHAEDGVARPLALNLHVFLDDVTAFNGPLTFIPGSHKQGRQPASLDVTSTSYPLWVVDQAAVARLAEAGGIVQALGAAGTGLIFGDLTVHGSPANHSPWNRAIFSAILNPVSNPPTKFARPAYKHHRSREPVTAQTDDCLLSPLVDHKP